ncbi:MAG: 4-hydroxybutyrate CoA-transferase [Chloracidobacterium sp.]|nr:4-hydroxybutyrate CoA-transferase [Chloracidobacterium sp.]MDW8217929.1 acetyl-CoA hydrolase/transferase C-terminal domain-containing protein [Acidobacteriota bacterium]
MDWKARYAEKLRSPEEAARMVQSGDRVWVGMFNSTPETMAKALYARHTELRDVELHHYVAPFVWATPETHEAFRVVSAFTTPADRQQANAGLVEYLPLANFRQSWLKAAIGGERGLDVCIVKTSPPDENGFMSLGGALWANRTMMDISRRIICEVDERLIRTYGENWVHISETAALVEHNPADDRPSPMPPHSPETEAAAEVICTLIAAELIRDGDTLQIGIGDVTAAMARYLGDKRDLGIQTELIPGGVIDLMEQGVVTGRFKQIAPGKVVGTALAAMSSEEARKAHLNPRVELWDFCHTDDLRVLVREENFVAINNGLHVDVTGQVTAETLDGKLFSGPGGQTVFAVAAAYSEGGRSIIALPSSSVVGGERRSRIVAQLPPGSMVTVTRGYVDYVVTEQGIATLCGKTVRQRIEELVNVAHPDFRAELRKEAQRLYSV